MKATAAGSLLGAVLGIAIVASVGALWIITKWYGRRSKESASSGANEKGGVDPSAVPPTGLGASSVVAPTSLEEWEVGEEAEVVLQQRQTELEAARAREAWCAFREALEKLHAENKLFAVFTKVRPVSPKSAGGLSAGDPGSAPPDSIPGRDGDSQDLHNDPAFAEISLSMPAAGEVSVERQVL